MSKRSLAVLVFVVSICGGGVAHATAVPGAGVLSAQIGVDPTEILFGTNEVGHASATRAVIATNTGTVALVISGVSFPASGASYTVTGPMGTQTLNPGATAQWDIACEPALQGTVDGALRIASNAPANPTVDVLLTCSGTRGQLATDQATLDFGGVALNTTRTRTIVISNSGNLPVASIAAAFDLPTAGFSIDPMTSVPASLAPGAAVTLIIKFTPDALSDGGPVKLMFGGTWGASPGNPTSVVVNLIAQTVALGVDPAAIDFGSFLFDGAPTKVFHIINGGTATLEIDQPIFVPDTGSTDAEVTIVSVKRGGATISLPASLGGGTAFDITVKATPANRMGTLSGHILVHSTTPGIPDQTIAITGTATAATITTADVDFGAVDLDDPAAQTRMAVISNGGTGPLTITAMTPLGVTGPFTVTGTPGQVAPGATTAITITYKPTGTRTAADPDKLALVVTFSGVIGAPPSSTIMVQGRGIDRVFALDATPTFPPTFRNPGDTAPIRPITVHNNGEAVLKVTGVMITGGPVWLLVDSAPVEIAGGGSHDFLVRFAPNAIGLAPVGELTLINNDDANPVATVTLTGLGVARDVAFGPATLDLGSIVVGGQLEDQRLAVTNMDSEVAFTIRAIELSDGSVFHLEKAPSDQGLPAAAEQHFVITFAPTATGHFETTAVLYLDQDDNRQAEVKITADAAGFVSVHGGGGCDTGGHAGGGALIALALLAGRRRRRSAALAVGALVLLGSTVPTRADDVVIGVFDPTPATSRTGFQLETPDVGRSGAWAASIVASYATDVLVFDSYNNGTQLGSDGAITQRTMFSFGGAYAFLDRFEAGIRLPVYSQHGDPIAMPAMGAAYVSPAAGTALGDLTLHLKARLARSGSITAGAVLHVTLPTSTAGQFTGVDGPTARALGLVTWSPRPRWSLVASAGGVLRKSAVYRDGASISQGSGIAWGLGVSFRAFDRMWATGEIFGEVVRSGRSELGMNTLSLAPIEALAGAKYRLDRGVSIGVALGRGVTDGIGAPGLRGVLMLSYGTDAVEPALPRRPAEPIIAPDGDGDGISDARDRCPREAEDKDGFHDEDGCPDPDNDGDGIIDTLDKCPNDAEDKDGFQDGDGCPDPDNDADGIADAIDRCPNEPETINGKNDDDGCPDELDRANLTKPAPSTQSPTKAAEDTFAKGRALLKQSRYREACAAFEQSQRLDPQFGTQYNIAGCYEKIGKLATAWNLYRELLRSDTNPTRRSKARGFADALARRVPKIKLVLAKKIEGAQVRMNGVDATVLLGIETPVDLGSYALVVDAAGYRTWSKTVTPKEGEVVTVEIELLPVH